MSSAPRKTLDEARAEFIGQWGVIGSNWGVSRTLAMIHALLLTAPEPLATDEVMSVLQVSRGSANTNLRELVSWGLVRKVVVTGERRDFFEAEKDVWKIFCTVARERRRREIDPVLTVLRDCAERTARLRGAEARTFNGLMREIAEFVEVAGTIMDRVADAERSKLLPAVLKLLG